VTEARYLLDTNACIHLFARAYPALTARVGQQPAGSLAISAITYAEIAIGTRNGRLPAPDQLAGFVEEIPVLPFDPAAASAYGGLPFLRGSFDRLIGAHAIAAGLTLVTNNVRDFADMPGLRVENWTVE
jgi:tRNA(fMet)-specific endonuclease VapC